MNSQTALDENILFQLFSRIFFGIPKINLSDSQANKLAEQEHYKFMTANGKSLAEKHVALKEKSRLKDSTPASWLGAHGSQLKAH